MQHMSLKTPMKTHFASKVIMYKETLEFVNAINIHYTQQNSIFAS
jgi:hypothetical protein